MLPKSEREVAVYLFQSTQKAIAEELDPVTLTAENILDIQVMLLPSQPKHSIIPGDEKPLCFFEIIGAHVLPP